MRLRLKTRKTINTHIPEHPVITIYGILHTLLGECLTLDFWRACKENTAKEVVVHDKIYETDFKLVYVHGKQSLVHNVLKTYTFKIGGAPTLFSIDLTTAVNQILKAIENHESSFLILSQLPYGGGTQLLKGIRSKCIHNNYRIPDLTKINELANKIEKEKVVMMKYNDEIYITGLDSLFLTFIYWRTLTTPPKPTYTEITISEG